MTFTQWLERIEAADIAGELDENDRREALFMLRLATAGQRDHLGDFVLWQRELLETDRGGGGRVSCPVAAPPHQQP